MIFFQTKSSYRIVNDIFLTRVIISYRLIKSIIGYLCAKGAAPAYLSKTKLSNQAPCTAKDPRVSLCDDSNSRVSLHDDPNKLAITHTHRETNPNNVTISMATRFFSQTMTKATYRSSEDHPKMDKPMDLRREEDRLRWPQQYQATQEHPRCHYQPAPVPTNNQEVPKNVQVPAEDEPAREEEIQMIRYQSESKPCRVWRSQPPERHNQAPRTSGQLQSSTAVICSDLSQPHHSYYYRLVFYRFIHFRIPQRNIEFIKMISVIAIPNY